MQIVKCKCGSFHIKMRFTEHEGGHYVLLSYECEDCGNIFSEFDLKED